MYNNNNEIFQRFKLKQDKLSGILSQSSEVVSFLQMTQNETLKQLSEKVSKDSFKIMVLGTFKNGKSTFINSFFGKGVLPTHVTPTTAVITEVKYGNKNKAILYFRDPLPEKLLTGIPDITMNHMQKYGMKNIPPIEIPFDKINEYVVIPNVNKSKDRGELDYQSPYEKVELYWPLDLLQNNVEIIDSPGLNENKARTEATMQYLSQADSIIFVLNATAACSEKEMDFVQDFLKAQGHEDIIFVVNRLNQLNNDNERAEVMEYIKPMVSSYTSFGTNGVFPVSAYDALNGRANENEAQFIGSGMQNFEPFLADFLVNKRGKIKLTQPAKLLKNVLREANDKVIPDKLKMLDMGIDELKDKYEKSKPNMELLMKQKESLRKKVDTKVELMMPEIKRCVNNYYSDLKTNSPHWVDEYNPKSEVKLTRVKESAGEMIKEISQHLEEKVQEEQTAWRNDVLTPLMQDKISEMMESLETPLENFYMDLENFKIGISGGTSEDITGIPVWQRVTGVVGGLLLGDIGIAAMGGVAGISKEFVKGVALQISAYCGLFVFGLLNPVTIVAVVIASVFKGLRGNANQMTQKVKEGMIDEVVKSLEEQQLNSIDDIIYVIKDKIIEIGNTVVAAVDHEIQDAKKQVEETIKSMEKGEANIKDQKTKLIEHEDTIRKLNKQLDDFILDLV